MSTQQAQSHEDDPFPLHLVVSRPYLSKQTLENLREQRKVAPGREKATILQAWHTISAVGERLCFPIRTMGSAMILFQRFMAFNPPMSESTAFDVSLACLFSACKLEDTVKKLRDVLVTALEVRHPGQHIDPDTPKVDEYRRRLIGMERHVLETDCFDFRIHHPQKYIIKICRYIGYPRHACLLAWNISIDSYKTASPLEFTPHVVALACIYIALQCNGIRLTDLVFSHFCARSVDVYDCLFEILDLYIDLLPQTRLCSMFPNTNKFMEIRIGINRALQQLDDSKDSRNGHSSEYPEPKLSLRNPTIGDRGAVRYIVN